jgi:hypothetical protein
MCAHLQRRHPRRAVPCRRRGLEQLGEERAERVQERPPHDVVQLLLDSRKLREAHALGCRAACMSSVGDAAASAGTGPGASPSTALFGALC